MKRGWKLVVIRALDRDLLRLGFQSKPQWKEDGNTFFLSTTTNTTSPSESLFQSKPQWKEDGNRDGTCVAIKSLNNCASFPRFNQNLNEKRMETSVAPCWTSTRSPRRFNQNLNEKRMETRAAAPRCLLWRARGFNQNLNEKRMET
jgi:hypothetical protein